MASKCCRFTCVVFLVGISVIYCKSYNNSVRNNLYSCIARKKGGGGGFKRCEVPVTIRRDLYWSNAI
jgi:hypothetical protein